MRTKFVFLAFLINLMCFSQSSKTHYIPPLSNTTFYPTENHYLYISCSSPTDITYKITPIGGTPTTGTVRRDNPQEILIGSGSDTQILANATKVSTILNNKGYIIEAEDLVYVTVRVIANSSLHAGGLVSKGLAALGTQFRIGAFTNKNATPQDNKHYTFASILATENNTTVSFSDLKPGIVLLNNSGGSTPASVTLNAGQSYIIAAQGTTNIDRMIGALITSNKPIAVNCGSYGGSNGFSQSSDLGFDQIVSAERTGKEYIFIRGEGGTYDTEHPLIVAHVNNTEIYLNGSTTPAATINAGQYYDLTGTAFTPEGNLYVKTSENVFAYQGIDGGGGDPNQNLHFLPPLSCETPKIIDNIPFINKIGTVTTFNGNVCLVTETGASLNFLINGTNYTLATLSTAGITVSGPNTVTGNAGYVTYKFSGMTGNVSVYSTKSVYLSYYGTSGAATYGGFYSGFTYKPEITFAKINTTLDNSCIPNVKLGVNATSSFDNFQWFFNGNPIPGATANSYTPTQPGFYKVRGVISSCSSAAPLESEDIPVSSCPTNLDNDLVNDNYDIDLDNDGITNCTESSGNQTINATGATGSIASSSITYTNNITTSGTAATTPFTGNTDGSFITETPAGKGNSVSYNLTFNQPINIGLEYPATVNVSDLLNSNAEYFINSDTNKTITILNPTNQLLIDTNYDGIYESGITEFSSFEIRFRLNGSTPLASGTGNFKLLSYQTRTFKITHKNISDNLNKSSFKIFAPCVAKDTDTDGNPDQTDSDSDNDGIPDITEAQVNNALVLSGTDTNKDGLDNTFEPGLTPVDTDNDGVKDYLDLDSDNDGILDKNEGIADTDTDGIKNYRELDSDNDLCFDVKEAGFLDPNNDGLLGAIAPPTTNANGLVTSGVGYTTPNNNYIISAPIVINTQPQVTPTCEFEKVTISLADNGGNTYQWQLSTDGATTWTNLANNATYSGTASQTLVINSVTMAMDGFRYRVYLKKTGNSCDLISSDVSLKVLSLPVVNTPISITQCDSDNDAVAPINLTIKNDQISSNYQNETFTYYKTLLGAQNADPAQFISNPRAFQNFGSPFNITVWARVQNTDGCYRIAEIRVQVIVTQISKTYSFSECDDYLNEIDDDHDGISKFNVSSVEADLRANVLPTTGNYSIQYYRNVADRDAQTNPIVNPVDFRNDIPINVGITTPPFIPYQTIWARVNSNVSSDCFGFARIDLIVEKLPKITPIAPYLDCNAKNGISLFNTSTLESDILAGQTNVNVTYFDSSNNPLKDSNGVLITSPFPATFSSRSQTITARLTNSTTNDPDGACWDEVQIKFTASNKAILLPPTVVDLTDYNTITVHISGDGDYVYSLDNPDGPFQTSNTFLNVMPDIHIVYVKDLNGCGTSNREVYVLGIPKFLTPNGDGYHDTWNVKGISKLFNAKTIIYIFDRYGKLLKQISPLGEGWNGTYNGEPLPADDYWYSIQFEDGRIAKGNFALKR